MKRTSGWMGFWMALCTAGAVVPATAAPLRLQILTTNDLHGAVDGVDTPELAGDARWLGGFDYVAGLIDKLRAKAPDRTIVLDAGDCFQGVLGVNRLEGMPCARFRDLAGFTATTLGNHEFDYQGCGDDKGCAGAADPQCALKRTMSEARTPTVAANVRIAQSRERWMPHGLRPFVVVPAGGVKVGIIGVLTETAAKIIMPGALEGLAITSAVDEVRQLLPEMRAAGADLVIVLAHMNGDCDGKGTEIAPQGLTRCSAVTSELGDFVKAFTPDEIALVVAGHAHAYVAGTRQGIPVIEILDRGQMLGRAEIDIDPVTKRVLPGGVRVLPPAPVCRQATGGRTHNKKYWRTGSICSPAFPGWEGVAPSHPEVRKLRDEVTASVSDVCSEVVAEATQDIKHGRGRETSLGNLTADLMREAANDAEVAFINLGGIRDHLRAGPINMCHLHAIWPFDNRLVEISMTGEEVNRLFRFLIGTLHKAVAVSGVTIERRRDGDIGLRDSHGEVFHQKQRYRVVTIDFLVNGGDRLDAYFKELPKDRFRMLDFPTYRDAMKKALSSRKTITRPAKGRFQVQP